MSGQIDIDEAWRLIVQTIPTRHIRRPCQAGRAFGFRRGLALFAGGRPGLRYLEVGTRLGHSLALVCLVAGDNLGEARALDCWIGGYGGEPNPGADAVARYLDELGIGTSRVVLQTGDSHKILPAMVDRGELFDLVLIDGDHTESGAMQDLECGLELLAPCGSLVFDDCAKGPEGDLESVWRVAMSSREGQFSSTGLVTESAGVPAWAWATKEGE
jgi:hypothetical protein